MVQAAGEGTRILASNALIWHGECAEHTQFGGIKVVHSKLSMADASLGINEEAAAALTRMFPTVGSMSLRLAASVAPSTLACGREMRSK